MGLTVVMLTGDNEKDGESIGREAGAGPCHCRCAARWKETVIRELRSGVAMVGDGINDAGPYPC